MPLDGITAYFLSGELNSVLSGGRIEKINQPNPYDLNLRIRKDGNSFQLIISANPSEPRIYLSDDIFTNPAIPFRFCTILRKYLSGARIISITSPGVERIFTITLQTTNEIGDYGSMSLVAEIMGRHSNIIFLNENSRIMDAVFHIDNSTSRVREILPAGQYTLPPSQNKLTISQVKDLLVNRSFFGKSVEQSIEKYILSRVDGFSPVLTYEVAFLAGLDPKTSITELSNDSLESLSNALESIIKKILAGEIQPSIVYATADDLIPSDFHSLALTKFDHHFSYATISEVMREFYRKKNAFGLLQQRKSALKKLVETKLKHILHKIEIHNQDLNECMNYELNKLYGDLIFSNKYLLNGGETSFIAVNYLGEKAEEIVISLNENLTASQNAQKYFKKFQKLKSKHESVSSMLEEEHSQAEYFESILIAVANAENSDDITALEDEFSKILLLNITKTKGRSVSVPKSGKNRISTNKVKKAAKAKDKLPADREIHAGPRKFISSDGYEIFIGRNSLQNEYVTFKISAKDDLWFHVQKAPGTHTLIKTHKTLPPDRTLEEAAMLTAWYSRKEGLRETKLTIDYCSAGDVRKQKSSTPGHVLYSNFSSLTVFARIPEALKEQVKALH